MSTPRIGSSIRTISASEPSARANSAFCWLPPDSDRMLLSHVGRADADPLLPVLRPARPRARGEISRPLRSRAQRADADVLGDRPVREDAVRLPVAGDQRHRRGHLDRRRWRRAAASKIASSRSVWPWPARPARPMISPSRATSSRAVVLPRRPRPDPQRRVAGATAAAAGRGLACASAPPIAATSRVAVEGRRPRRPRRPCRRASRRCGRRSPAPRRAGARSGCSSSPAADEAPHEGQQLARRMGVERRGRLVEDDELAAGRRVTVKARATSTIWRRPIERSPTMSSGRDAVAGKDLVELGGDQLAGAAPPAEAAQRRMVDARVLGHA